MTPAALRNAKKLHAAHTAFAQSLFNFAGQTQGTKNSREEERKKNNGAPCSQAKTIGSS
jgi:hypothetical protein